MNSTQVETTAGSSGPNSGTLRVLVVDDDVDAATSLTGLLRILGCHAEMAFGAETGLLTLEQLDPALVFVDLAMPGCHGLDMMKLARASPSASPPPLFVCLTALNGYEKQASEAGFDHYVIKPMEPGTLHDILAQARARAAIAKTRSGPRITSAPGAHPE